MPYVSHFKFKDKLARTLWAAVYHALFRVSPVPFHFWRRLILRVFGATIEQGANAYPKCIIWAPWNLKMGKYSCLANHVDCYNVAPVALRDFSTVSQYSFLCTATHDYESPRFDLIAKPITVGNQAWIAAGAFVGPGISIGDGAVVGARSSVTRDVAPWTVVAGNPARLIKHRVIRSRN
jgi:putative colanic acid biosynthesis acetyltransferase WcaF